MPTEKSDATDAGSYLAGTEFLMCRRFGHRFLPMHDGWLTEGTGAEAVYVIRLLCDSATKGCGSKRFDYYDLRTLEFTHREYDYAAGYLVDGFTVRRGDANRVSLEKFLAGQRAAERAAARARAGSQRKPQHKPQRKPGTAAARNLRAV